MQRLVKTSSIRLRRFCSELLAEFFLVVFEQPLDSRLLGSTSTLKNSSHSNGPAKNANRRKHLGRSQLKYRRAKCHRNELLNHFAAVARV